MGGWLNRPEPGTRTIVHRSSTFTRERVKQVRTGQGLNAHSTQIMYASVLENSPRGCTGVGFHTPNSGWSPRSSSLRCSQLFMKDALASSLPRRIRDFLFPHLSRLLRGLQPEFGLSSQGTGYVVCNGI